MCRTASQKLETLIHFVMQNFSHRSYFPIFTKKEMKSAVDVIKLWTLD